MNKRGAGHIEVILSFVIFVGAIGFAIYFFSPNQSDNSAKTALNYAFDEIQKNASTLVKTYSVKTTLPSNYVWLTLNISYNDVENVHAESYNGGLIHSKKDNGKILISPSNQNFVYVKLSEDFEPDPQAGSILGDTYSEGGFGIISSDSKEIISYKKLLLLNESYYSNYENLKNNFNLPRNANFGFVIISDGKEIIKAEMDSNGASEVYTDIKKTNMLMNEKEVLIDLLIKVW